MDDPAYYNRSRVAPPQNAQLLFFKVTTLVLFVLLVAGAGFYFYRLHATTPVTIVVDGAPVATVESIATASKVVRAVCERQVGTAYMGSDDPHVTQNIEFRRVSSDVPIDSPETALSKLAAVVTTTVQADVIIVNQKWIVALPDATTAQTAVDEVREHYSSLPPADPVEDKPTFVQNVTIERHWVPAKLTSQTPEDAAAILWTPPAPVTYTVQPHETGWLISKKFHMKFSDFLRANAGADINHLTPGDFVVVSKTFPPVDVVVKKISQVNQSFGGSGVRQVTLESTYLDGQLTGTPVATNMVTVQRATPRAEIY